MNNARTAMLACTLAAAAAVAATVTATANAQTPTQAAQAGGKLQAPMTLVTAAGTGKMIGSVMITESPTAWCSRPP
jgi:Cu-Zn family superoxide dismutase